MTTLRHHARHPRAVSIMQQIEALRPRTAVELHQFVQNVLRLKVPRQPIVEGNDAPFQYLLSAFFESGRDLAVWASRGGGKTCLGAAATVLDMLFKPGIQIRILGGSRDQSEHMYRHLMNMMAVPLLRPLLVDDPTMRRMRLVNGSEVELLAQSETSVRGQRVHKLRCDELELFDRTVWNAAQRVTRSATLGGVAVRGTIEALSTFHRPFGLMNEIIGPATDDRAGGESAHASPFRVIRWSVLDVIERCLPARSCEGCPIRADCRGRARDADGFVKVDDVIAQFRRSSDQAWASEMMCSRPSVEANVYPSFVPEKHVIEPPKVEETEKASASVQSQPKSAERKSSESDGMFIAGMDFGIRSPLVMLWGRLHGPADAPVTDRVVEIVDEYLQAGLTMDTHCRWIEQRAWPRPEWIGVDPAGDSRNSQTGVSDIACLRRFGYRIRRMASPIRTGIEIIRRRLDRGTLIIHPRCEALILGLRQYHFNIKKPNDPNPVKDGPDHVCDALRYMLVNLEKGTAPVKHRRW
ncbi:MAG: hypothetical protein IT444_11185 [Phycisphaeraceae bacterium]|nr:hypothetical protein [Phycisphaeraceae bacterium]